MEYLETIVLIALSAVGGLTLVVRGLTELAKLTKSTRDDAILAKVGALLDGLAGFIDRFIPTARPPADD